MVMLYPGTHGNDKHYRRLLFLGQEPRRIGSLLRRLLLAIFGFTGVVGLGYLYGLTERKRSMLRE